ncbi:SLC13 family permease [Oleidesulfovibrio alaskensis]|jgi:di/tricarboxylate transporter|uniref:SLC13 family permease n=1 Tax=Oleidesulfovibrio alaskensis TaxID=58180 RepID=UPI001A55F780|nr:SLC13 family permease [Oleidesulfovibrio alaskensis]MBL3581415.1 SLC13 family permease [Oleidesulfovibrio alaskensis]
MEATFMSPQVLAVTAILILALYLLVTEKWPLPLTALGIIVGLCLAEALVGGILSFSNIFGSFGSRGPLAVAMLFIVSRGLIRSGALSFVVNLAARLTGGKPLRLMIFMVTTVITLSAFLNNTPVVILFISIILMLCERFRLVPSKFMIPLSFASILGGTCTLIGTSTNIILSDMMVLNKQAPLGMFELSVVGVPLAIIGGLFLIFVAPRLLPERKSTFISSGEQQENLYLSEVVVPEGSPLAGVKISEASSVLGSSGSVVEQSRQGEMLYLPGREDQIIYAGDLLVVSSPLDTLTSLLASRIIVLRHGGDLFLSGPSDARPIAELIVPPASRVRGRRLWNTAPGRDENITVIGVRHKEGHYAWQKTSQLRLAAGDTLLVQGTRAAMDSLASDGDFIIMEEAGQKIHYSNKAPLALGLFLAMVVVASVGIMGILPAATIAAFLMILTRCVNLKESFRSLDGEVLLLIIATISLGKALSQTGAADVYAHAFLTPFEGVSARFILLAVVTLTALITNFLSNNSAAALLTPVAVSIGMELGVDPRAFLIGIALGASACYLTPIGYQTNLLVYAPGGYKFSDFMRVGLPMTLLVIVLATVMIPMFFPFTPLQ